MRRAARYLSLFGPLLVVLAFSKVHAAVVADPPYDYTSSFRFAWSLGYALVLGIAAYGLGLPELARTRRQLVQQTLVASLVAAIAVSVVQLLVGGALLPRFVVLGAALGVIPVHGVSWMFARHSMVRDESRDRVVLVGSEVDRADLVVDLDRSPEQPAVLIAHVVADVAMGATTMDKPLIDLVLEAGATVLVLDRSALAVKEIIEQASPLHEAGVRVRTLLEFYEEWLGKLPVSELERASLFFDISEIHRQRYGRAKRLVDIACGLAGLVPLALSLPFVLVGNLAGNRGGLLYRQERVGRGGATFDILKFRTMVSTVSGVADTSWTKPGDARITAFGGFLRQTHLDELPQVLNILRGDLSVVGPRPEQPRYVTELSAKLPFYGMRHLVRPGLTGWAQVKYGYAGDETDALQKLQYEFFYLRHQSLRFDLRIIGRTVRSVMGSEGAGR